MENKDNSTEYNSRKYRTRAIISIPFMYENSSSNSIKDKFPSKDNRFKSKDWETASLNENVKDLGLLPQLNDLFKDGNNHFDGNDIQIFSLKKNDNGVKKIFDGNSYNFSSKSKKEPFNFTIKFSLYDDSDKDQEETFWEIPKLILFPLAQIGLLTLPIYLIEKKGEYDTDIKDIYTFYNKLSVSISYPWKIKGNGIKYSMGEIFDSLTKDLYNVGLLTSKCLITFIYLYNADLKDQQEAEFKECSEKLTYTDNRDGFVIDDKETSFLQLLTSQKLFTSAGPFGAAFVTNDISAFRLDSINKYYWIFLLLLIQRYSLIKMLYDLNNIFSGIASQELKGHKKFRNLQLKYQAMCQIKAGLYFTEISDQYHNMRLYHNFFDALNIKTLYNEVEEKLEALDKYLSIEKDKQSWLSQKIIAALVLLLTATSGVNDFLDILEDPSKIHPGVISLLAAIAIIVILWHKEES